jgi:hypothetical protein
VPSPTDRNGGVQAEEPVQVDEATTVQSFSTWDAPTGDDAIELPGPGPSWDAEPPKDTGVPVSDEMIQTLVGGFPPESPEIGAPPEEVDVPLAGDQVDDQVIDELRASIEERAPAQPASVSQPNIDHLLKIARELEYGLIELADSVPAASAPEVVAGPVDTAGLGGALAGLQSDEDLKALRDAVETARERPRDVDVMLDLVLRADAIAAVIEERDRLKAAIEAATSGPSSGEDSQSEVDTSDGPDDAGEPDPEPGDAADDDAEESPYAST